MGHRRRAKKVNHQKQKNQNRIQTATKLFRHQNQAQNHQKRGHPLDHDPGHEHVRDREIGKIIEKIIEIITDGHAVDHDQIHHLILDQDHAQNHSLDRDRGHVRDHVLIRLGLLDRAQVAHPHILENVNGNVTENVIEDDDEEVTESQVIHDRVVEVVQDQIVQATADHDQDQRVCHLHTAQHHVLPHLNKRFIHRVVVKII